MQIERRHLERRHQNLSKLSILPATKPAAKVDEAKTPSRTQWLRGGRQPAIVVTNEAGELIYTVHRAIHHDP